MKTILAFLALSLAAFGQLPAVETCKPTVVFSAVVADANTVKVTINTKGKRHFRVFTNKAVSNLSMVTQVRKSIGVVTPNQYASAPEKRTVVDLDILEPVLPDTIVFTLGNPGGLLVSCVQDMSARYVAVDKQLFGN